MAVSESAELIFLLAVHVAFKMRLATTDWTTTECWRETCQHGGQILIAANKHEDASNLMCLLIIAKW